jgi:anti-sigma regulatory factor (Ser/Thr protein kinase)
MTRPEATDGVHIDASAESIAEARRMVVAQLSAWGLAELADDARLIVSELLTNAALHARPPVSMKLTRLSSGVKLEVSDGSVEMPLLIRAGTDVMTGRGWMLIAALSKDWGVTPSAGGKVVWATLRLGQHDPSAARGNWAAALPDQSRTVQADLLPIAPCDELADFAPRYEVVLGGIPTDFLLEAKAHIDSLIREFALVASGAATGAAEIPLELTSLIARVTRNFAEARQSIKEQAVAARQRKQPRTELVLRLPLSAADAGLEYLAAVDEVDAYCRAAQMLTLESPPDHRIFRHWYVEELVTGLRVQAAAAEHGTSPSWRPEPFESRLRHAYEQDGRSFPPQFSTQFPSQP